MSDGHLAEKTDAGGARADQLIAAGPVQFCINRFLFGFCSYPVLIIVPIIILTLALGLGEGFGVTDLIYHQDRGQQVFGGVVLAFVLVACGYAGFLFDTRRYPLNPDGKSWYDVPHWGFWLYLGAIALSFAAVLAVGVVFYAGIVLVLIWLRSVSGLDSVWNPLELFVDPEAQREYEWFFVGLAAGLTAAMALGTFSYWVWSRLSPKLLRPRPAAPAEPTVPAEPVSRRVRYCRPLWLGGNRPHPLWWLACWLLVVFLLIHAGVCAVAAAAKVHAWVGFAGTAGLLLAVCLIWHRPLGRLLIVPRGEGGAGEEAGLDRYHYRGAGMLFVVLALGVFGLIDRGVLPVLSKDFGEPTTVPLFGAVFFVFISLYTLITIAYRRAVSVIALGAVVLLVFAGIPPYKFRFPGFEDRYRDGQLTEGDPFYRARGLLDLRNQARYETTWRAADEQEFKRLKDENSNPADHPEKFQQLRERDYRLLPGPEPDFETIKDLQPRAAARAKWRQRECLIRTDDLPATIPDVYAGGQKVGKPLVIVSVSGGGHAAAVWTFGVLNRLEARFAAEGIDFPAHVLLMTGASGGMMGAGAYAVSLPDHAEGAARDRFLKQVRDAGPNGRLGEAVEDLLRKDFLTPLVNRMMFNDLPAYFSPFPNLLDRGRVLEEQWEKWSERFDPAGKTSPFALTFGQLKDQERAGRSPYLVFAPMMIEDGRRLLISNLDLSSVASNDGNGLERETVEQSRQNYTFSRGELELFRAFREQHNTFKLSTAVRMSASFPFFSPAVSLPTIPRRRVVDAGYYDNYGVCVAASWLFSTDSQEWLDTKGISKVVVIQIRSSRSERERRLEFVPEPEDNLLSRAMEEVISPVEGLNQARVGSSSFRNDGQLELLSKYFREKKEGGDRLHHTQRYFTTITFELEKDVTLSWYLGRRDQKAITAALESSELTKKIEYFLKWFQTAHAPPPARDAK